MSTELQPMAERHAALLAELAEIGMTMARDLQDQVLAAETPEAKAAAVAAFPRVARCVRQCLALEAKLARDQLREDRQLQQDAEREIAKAMRKRKAQVRFVMRNAICAAHDDDEPDDTVYARLEELRDRTDDDVLGPDFLTMPFDEVIARLHQDLGLDPPANDDDDLGDDDEGPDDDEGANNDGPEAAAPPYFNYSSG